MSENGFPCAAEPVLLLNLFIFFVCLFFHIRTMNKSNRVEDLIANLSLNTPTEDNKFCLIIYEHDKSIFHIQKSIKAEKAYITKKLKLNQIAGIHSSQYTKVFSKPKEQQPNYKALIESTITDISFQAKDFEEAIDELKSNSAAGSDGFPVILHKKNLVQLLLFFSKKQAFIRDLFVKSLKIIYATYLQKRRRKALAAYYKPVALTSHLIEIF